MKKSELRKIIRESIKGLMKEQYGTGTKINVRTCSGGITVQNFCIPNSFNGQVGDTFIVNTSFNPAYVGKEYFIRDISNNSCNPTMNGVQTTISPNTGTCTNCCIYNGYEWGLFTPSGACWNSCSDSTTSSGSCNPNAWSNHANWTNTFTNTVNNLIANPNPNQPCNFLTQKKNQFTSMLGGGGANNGNAANQWQCKLDLITQLHSSNNC